MIGQIANLQALYDYLDNQLALTAKLAVSNVFTQPQQVPNATLPQHAPNKLQVETMFEMFKRELRGYNVAMPDLTGKTEISAGVYRLFSIDTLTLDYDVYSGEYIINGTKTSSNVDFPLRWELENGVNYTATYIYISGSWVRDSGTTAVWSLTFRDGGAILTNQNNYLNNNIVSVLVTSTINRITLNISFGTQTFTNLRFKLQLEKGSTATPYNVPGEIPQYKIVGEA